MEISGVLAAGAGRGCGWTWQEPMVEAAGVGELAGGVGCIWWRQGPVAGGSGAWRTGGGSGDEPVADVDCLFFLSFLDPLRHIVSTP